MALPIKPKISEEEKAKGLESFINGGNPTKEALTPSKAEKVKNTDEDMSVYLLKLPQELHKKTKIICVEKGISMKDYIIEAITEKNLKTSK